jgi:Icc-related predicted phosphoesterase
VIPPCDVLAIAGDIFPSAALDEAPGFLDRFREWLDSVPARCVLAVWGNGDSSTNLQVAFGGLRLRILHNDSTSEAGLTWFGVGCTPASGGADDAMAYRALSSLEGVDVVIAHVPPFGLCDRTADANHVGSRALLSSLSRIRPRLTVCGHVHESGGTVIAPWGGIVVNAAYLDRNFRPARGVRVFELAILPGT